MSTQNKENKWKEVLESLGTKFDELKPILDKYPNAFSIKYLKGKGYKLFIKEDAILNHSEHHSDF